MVGEKSIKRRSIILRRYDKKMISQAHFMALKSNEKIFYLSCIRAHVATGFICAELYKYIWWRKR